MDILDAVHTCIPKCSNTFRQTMMNGAAPGPERATKVALLMVRFADLPQENKTLWFLCTSMHSMNSGQYP